MAGRRGALVAAAVGAGSLVLAALWALGPYVFGNRDHAESIDSRPVHDAALAACQEMRARLASARGDGENQAVEAMVARIRALGPDALRRDVPVESWLRDWERLVAARRRAAASGEQLAVPEAGGVPIVRRMDELVKGGDLRPCRVPEQLYRPTRPSS